LLLQHVEAGNRAEDLRMDVLQAIRFIIQAWDEVNAETICNCWRHTKILPVYINADVDLDIRQHEDLVLNELTDTLRALNFSYPMQVEEFLNIPEENVVYEVPRDDQIIEELVYLFGNTNKENLEEIDLEEIDDSYESPIISVNTAISSLETVHTFLLQQDNAEEYVKLVGKIEKFFRVKKTSLTQQSDIYAYFR